MDIDYRREVYRKRAKAVMVQRDTADNIASCEELSEIYGLPKRISALYDYFLATYKDHPEQIEELNRTYGRSISSLRNKKGDFITDNESDIRENTPNSDNSDEEMEDLPVDNITLNHAYLFQACEQGDLGGVKCNITLVSNPNLSNDELKVPFFFSYFFLWVS